MIYKYTETKTINNEIEIVPCPFCGSENVKPVHISGEHGYSYSKDFVTCISCGASGSVIKNDEGRNHMVEAINKWNNSAKVTTN